MKRKAAEREREKRGEMLTGIRSYKITFWLRAKNQSDAAKGIIDKFMHGD
jgi:hypothetical protein